MQRLNHYDSYSTGISSTPDALITSPLFASCSSGSVCIRNTCDVYTLLICERKWLNLLKIPCRGVLSRFEIPCIPFTLILKCCYLLVGSLWERMLINANKREEEEDGLRRENGEGVGCSSWRGLLGTRNEFIKGNERRNFPLESLREEMRFYGNSSISPRLSDTSTSVLATVASVHFLCDSVSYKILCWFRNMCWSCSLSACCEWGMMPSNLI